MRPRLSSIWPNSSGFPEIQTYIGSELKAGFAVIYMSQTSIITSDDPALVNSFSISSINEAQQAPTAGNAAILSLGANAGKSWVLGEIRWSYSDMPTNGQLTIAYTSSVGSETEKLYITAGGPGFLPFTPPKQFRENSAVTITLASGGGSVSGTVYADAFLR